MVKTHYKSKEELINALKVIGQDLIDRAEDIAVDWNKRIISIKVESKIEFGSILANQITKEYVCKNQGLKNYGKI